MEDNAGMDDGVSEQRRRDYAGSYEAFLALVEFLGSDQAMGMPVEELMAAVEPGFQDMLATLVREAAAAAARRSGGHPCAGAGSEADGGNDA